MLGYNVVFLLIIVAVANSQIVHHQNCPYARDTPINCTVHEVRIDACEGTAPFTICRVKQPTNASISFDYTADFEGETLESRAYWANSIVDLPFLGMETNACLTTACPVQPKVKQTYSLNLPVSKKFPSRTYDVKWKLWNTKEQECCFMIQLKLHK